MRLSPRLLLGLALLGASLPLWASCSIDSGTAPTLYNHSGQSKSLAITTAVGSHPFDFGGAQGINTWSSSCDGSEAAGYLNMVGSNSPLGYASGNYGNSNGNPIYGITALPGIGYAASWNLSTTGLNSYFQPYGNLSAPTSYELTDPSSMRIDFFVMSSLWAGSWCLSAGATLGEIRFGDQTVARLQISGEALCVNVTGRTCSVSSGSQNLSVAMGGYSLSQFSGIGYTTAPRPFNLQLESCTGGVAQVNIMFNATADSDVSNASEQGVVQLNSGGASGVALQLLRSDNTPLPLNRYPDTPLYSGSSLAEGASLTLPLRARYLQTQSSVTAGQANASVTFNLIYQ